jgi:hypothetical protein
LPSQRSRFVEMSSSRGTPTTPAPPSNSVPASTDSGFDVPQGSTNKTNSTNLPLGPRRHPQPPVRDASHPDFSRGDRMVPSGPSSTSGRSRAAPRMSNDYAFIPDSRSHTATDVDPPHSRAPPPRMSDTTTSTNSGVYADREQLQSEQSDNPSVPKAPRALRAPAPASPSTSRQEDLDSRRRDRSPPPHLSNKDGWDHSQERLPHNAGPAQRQDAPARRHANSVHSSAGNPSRQGPVSQGSGRNQVCRKLGSSDEGD